jgi:hypothetical protein
VNRWLQARNFQVVDAHDIGPAFAAICPVAASCACRHCSRELEKIAEEFHIQFVILEYKDRL